MAQEFQENKVSRYHPRQTGQSNATEDTGNLVDQRKITKQNYIQLVEKLQSIGPLQIIDFDDFLLKLKIDFEYFYRDRTIFDFKISDFKIIRKLGHGGFGKVVLAELNNDDTLYAIKVIDKMSVIKQNMFISVYNEKRILQSLNFPFVVYLKYFFVDYKYLYFVMPYVPGGNFSEYLDTQIVLSENQAKFYMSQLVLALEYLHYMGLIHRDVKPDNIMIDAFGYIKLCDFGLCMLCFGNDRAWTMAGTPYYMAPEIIMANGYDCAVDWWAVGVTIYSTCCGQFPFYDKNTYKTYELILSGKYEMPNTFSKSLKHLLSRLLEVEPEKRIANLKKGAKEIKTHNWFKSVDWLKTLNRTIEAPYIPHISE